MFTLLKQGIAVFLAISIAIPLQSTVLIAYAQSATDPSGDLASTERTEAAAVHGEFGTAAINVGGNSVNVTPESMLTPAELAALTQVLNAGQQTLQLNELGAAVAGQLSLHSDFASQISNLVIPVGVTALHDAAFMQDLNLNANLTNFGSIFAYSTNASVTNLTVSASNIYNTTGATLSSIVPTTLGITTAVPVFGLSLNAINEIVNAGTISSSGDLTLNAASVVNTGVIESMMNMAMTAASVQNQAAATMVAQQAMNANTSTLINSGLMSAMNGNLAVITASLTNNGIMSSLGAATGITVNDLGAGLTLLGSGVFATPNSAGIQ
jgi:adhesin HecA-like repeat protein